MDEKIRRAIRQRARHAHSKDELVQAVFDTFKASAIHPRDVSLEDMKTAVVEAARAARAYDDRAGLMPA